MSVLPPPSSSPQTLGHLEKAVVLELTLKHLNALTAVTEQQHQKIIALQKGESNKVGRPRPGIRLHLAGAGDMT